MKTKKENIKQTYAETFLKETNPVDFDVLKTLLENGRLSGYITKAGALSNGDSFADIHIVIKENTDVK